MGSLEFVPPTVENDWTFLNDEPLKLCFTIALPSPILVAKTVIRKDSDTVENYEIVTRLVSSTHTHTRTL